MQSNMGWIACYVALAMCIGGCGTKSGVGGESLVVVKVLEYSSAAMHDSTLVDDTIIHENWFDAAVCEIVSPAELAGEQLQIWGWNRQGGLSSEQFHKSGNTVRFRCDLSRRHAPPWDDGPTGFGQWEISLE